MLILQPDDMHVKYVPGICMYSADTLSQAYFPLLNVDTTDPEIDCFSF